MTSVARPRATDRLGRLAGRRQYASGLWALAVALLGIAWLFSTPLLQAPDESSQYLRALTLEQGHLIGSRVPVTPSLQQALHAPGAAAARLRWTVADTRAVRVPSSMSPADEVCVTGRPDVSGSCLEGSYNGDYLPVGYVLPAAAIAVAHDWRTAMWLSRGAALVQVVAFLALAVALVGSRARWALVGLLAAITPETLYVGSLMNPSGIEIAANVAFIAGLLALRREGPSAERWQWAATTVAGAVTILSWQVGPAFAALDLLAVAGLWGRGGLRALRVAHPRRLLAGGTVLALSVAGYVGWGRWSGAAHASLDLSQGLHGLTVGAGQLYPTLQGAVGIFGHYTIGLPLDAMRLWWLIVVALVLVGLWRGGARERIVLALSTAAALATPILLYGYAYAQSGFGLQGRYVLPAFALIPLVAAHVADHGAGRSLPRWAAPAPVALAAILALIQLYAWWWNAHVWSGTDALVLHRALFTPVAGWAPWMAAAAAAGMAMLVAIVLAARSPRAPLGV